MSAEHPLHWAMAEALRLARERRFHTAPNPCVGAVLVRDGVIVARGNHYAAGHPHAEIEVLRDAERNGVDPAACTLVVTLEPCAHYGKTPPCTDALLAAKIPHVVIGAMDPTSYASGPYASGGAEILRQAGVRVETGIARQECEDLISDFLTWNLTPYPYVLLKLAATLDGRIATRTGHSQWISCEESRAAAHELRRHMDAVLVGGNTFLADDPRLNYRPGPSDPPAEKQPLAVVATSRLPDAAGPMALVRERPTESIFWTTAASGASPKAEALRKRGIRVVSLPIAPRPAARGDYAARVALDLHEGLRRLREEENCHYALCEGGGRLGLSLLRDGLVGEFQLHLSPRILADNEATPLFDGICPLTLDESLPLRPVDSYPCGQDLHLILRPAASPLPPPLPPQEDR